MKKALYGLKQAPRAWYSKIDTYLIENGFKRSMSEPTLYVKNFENSEVIVLSLYVNDLLVTNSNPRQIDAFKKQMTKMFEMTNLGMMNYFFWEWKSINLRVEFSFLKRNMLMKS